MHNHVLTEQLLSWGMGEGGGGGEGGGYVRADHI